jgi:hypothetical protein
MPSTDVLVMVHGMTLSTQRFDHNQEYDSLWGALVKQESSLGTAFATRVGVEWGHEPLVDPPTGPRKDQRITAAENFIHDETIYANVKSDPSPQNRVLSAGAELFSKFVTRHLTDPIKETVLLLGVTDVFYYCAPDGEDAVRATVYSQVLDALEPFRTAPDVRLHVIGHSLGVTVAHDFLIGLIAPDSDLTGGQPGFMANPQASDPHKEQYDFWRSRAQPPLRTLTLGSKASTAGQLPLTVMRKQKLVDQLAVGKRLDPSVIGVPAAGPVKWKMFYDVDDILGFPARRLYDPLPTIAEYQVDTDWRPDLAHSEYWEDSDVIREIASLLKSNLV